MYVTSTKKNLPHSFLPKILFRPSFQANKNNYQRVKNYETEYCAQDSMECTLHGGTALGNRDLCYEMSL
jgi:hypothetical protein